MRTLLLKVPYSGKDDLVRSAIAEHSDQGFGGVDRFIGILNNEGNLYRIIVAESPIQASQLVGSLIDVGFIDRIGQDPKTFDDVDTLNGQLIRSKWTALLQESKTPHPIPAMPNLLHAVWEESNTAHDEEEGVYPEALAILHGLRPTKSPRIVDLLTDAGVDVSPWSTNKQHEAIDPYTNTYRNSKWSFGGGHNPIVVCFWWKDIKVEEDRIYLDGNSRGNANEWSNKLADGLKNKGEASRLRPKVNKAQDVDKAMSEAFLRRKPVRVIVLDGLAARVEEAEAESSSASKRLLDQASWFVHSHDPYTGRYELVRDVPMPPVVAVDPFQGATDPADDTEFQEFLDDIDLSETEKHAIIKARVGQGYFRSELIKRWMGGCSVTGCMEPSMLLASHILPWSKCTTRAERLSPANGLLLTPNLDRAFDCGLISFDDSFNILLSPKLNGALQNSLKIFGQERLRDKSFVDMRPFLKRHREEVFQK
jgi:HNH endonuclease